MDRLIVRAESPPPVLQLGRCRERRHVRHVIRERPPLEERRERRPRHVGHVRRADGVRTVERARDDVVRRTRCIARELVNHKTHEQPVGATVRESPDPDRIHQEVALGSREVLDGVVQVAENEIAEGRAVSGQKQTRPQLLGVVGQSFVQPEVLAGTAAPQQHVLVEADHVLEFVDERRRHVVLHAGRGVDAAQRSHGIGDDRIEHLAGVATAESREQVTAVEIPADIPLRTGTRHQGVHLAGHEHDDDAVVVDVRFASERGRVGCVQQRVEQRAQGIEVEARERTPVRLVRAVLEHGDVRSHIAREGDDRRVGGTVGIAAHLEHPPVADLWRRSEERCRRLRPVEPAHAARQVALRAPQGQVELLLGRDRVRTPGDGCESRDGRRHDGTAQQESRRVVRHAAGRLRHQQILNSRRGGVRTEHRAPRRLRGVDRRISRDRETDLPCARPRARCELGLHAARATGGREERRQPRQETPRHQRCPP